MITAAPVVHQDIEPYWSDRYGCQLWPVVTWRGQVLYGLQPKQWEGYQLTPLNPHVYWRRVPYEWIGFGGAAGGGKSYLARAIAASVNCQYPGSTCLILRKTQPEVIKNHVNKVRLELPREVYSLRSSPYIELTWKHNGSRTIFGYLRRFEDVYQYQGDEFDAIIFEESTHYDWRAVSWLMNNRLRSVIPGSKPFGVFPSNPGNVGHFWYKRIFIDRRHEVDRGEDPRRFVFLQAKLRHNRVLIVEDPAYPERLNRLPEPDRSWLADGDWTAGAGVALPELSRDVHIVPYFQPPEHWKCFGAFDWGFEHLWAFGYYAVNEDGVVFKCETVTGRRDQPYQIASKIDDTLRARGLSKDALLYVAAGWDCFKDEKRQYRVDDTPSIAERMLEHGYPLTRANISRVLGLQNLREYLAWMRQGPMLAPETWDDPQIPEFTRAEPALYFMDTAANRHCFECLESRVQDPDNIEDVLKTASDEFGEGGDDEYDETRYALASRPPRAKSVALDREVRAFDPELLAYEARTSRQHSRKRRPRIPNLPPDALHPEFGGQV